MIVDVEPSVPCLFSAFFLAIGGKLYVRLNLRLCRRRLLFYYFNFSSQKLGQH